MIRPEFQNRGIGTVILQEAITLGRRLGKRVVLGALHANRAADLYRRHGFVEYDKTDTHTLFRRETTATDLPIQADDRTDRRRSTTS